ncbi:hypothetical protein [Cytobacillus oceanisediminis]|uniref:hypothetical protein n=1 Tax=Cytobacillus oceanisediminis TaxID=665099 RepID=UPI00203CF25B|nr:hypothetical protein [Cytobacillus oceanisediminis]MCM3405490.1 hypothetical protein [Cytobacillus oceanisediminis]
MKLYPCDKCDNGQIARYGHVDNGVCFKCNGKGKLSYDPSPKDLKVDRIEWNEQERLEIEAEQHMIERAEKENWYLANNIETH